MTETKTTFYRIFTAQAPVNIAVIKYWGKSNESLKLPINDSLSGTLNIDQLCTTTSVAMSNTYQEDVFYLNHKQVDLAKSPQVSFLLDQFRTLSPHESYLKQSKVHIVSENNFPTAAGLASSAAGYACLTYVLGQTYGITDSTLLSRLARHCSGSACRSIFGGFVQWHRGIDDVSSFATQIVDQHHWPDMRVVICVINDSKKDVSSSDGMRKSVQTSELINFRANNIVPRRIEIIKQAIMDRDFETFARITIQDSNQFHAICLDSTPPLFYLNDVSRHVIKMCEIINSYHGSNRVAYTFDAGPNACIYLLKDFVPTFAELMKQYFGSSDLKLEVKGSDTSSPDLEECQKLKNVIDSSRFHQLPNSVSYLISTSIGCGPKLINNHIKDIQLDP